MVIINEILILIFSAFENHDMVPSTVLRAHAVAHAGTPVGVCVCGPEQMVQATWDTCSKLQQQGHQFALHRESYLL